jgi:serine/threonine protein kinase/tetratricopeptide (TPR) repeat protein
VNSSSSDEGLLARLLALPAAERMAALDRACADDAALRARVPEIMAALAAADSAHTGLGESRGPDSMVAAFNLALEAAPSETTGTRIGRYKLLQEIGRGGFGVVWMAEQETPIRRMVALKIIKAGMDTNEVIARFEAERQALALMEHPNIARVFDAGTTDTGRPYFVMELVRGVEITRYCDENRLSVDGRLRLFILACQAVQHAHQKGVIHRDLKPSNILVTLHDGVPVPKVIDFGIAKATMSQLTEKTLFTQFHAFIGTPAYTSPEQMEMSGLDVDTRSDIYSLGVLLYELLTGRPPFDAADLVKSGLEAMRRTIREVDPPRPSQRVTTLGNDDRVTIARQRSTEAVKLSVLLNGDLDWVVMRCLEKDRTRRYETANGLAKDIQRHLENEPVTARPPSTSYVLKKLVRRHKWAFIAAGSIAAVLVLGLVGTTWEAVRAVRAERAATRDRGRAEDLITFMLGDLHTQVAKIGRLDVLESVITKATDYFDTQDNRNISDTELLRRSKALVQIGQIREEQARYPEAEAAYSDAFRLDTTLTGRNPRNGDMLFERGEAEFYNGNLHSKRGEFSAAGEWFTRYHDTFSALVALDPTRPSWRREFAFSQHGLATVFKDQGDFDRARAGALAELLTLEDLRSQDPNEMATLEGVENAHSFLGSIAERQGQLVEAANQFSIQTTDLEQMVSKDPDNPNWQVELADTALEHAAIIDLITAHIEDAEKRLKRARGLLDELVARDPANRHWLGLSLHSGLLETLLLRRKDSPAAAALLLDKIRPQLEDLYKGAPTNRRFTLWLGMVWRIEAQLRASTDLSAAAVAAAKAVEFDEKLISERRANDEVIGECATAYDIEGEIAAKAGSGATAQGDWKHAAETLEPRTHGSHDWQLLDPAARVATWLGRADDAHAIISDLTQRGYVPLDPWPEIK